MKQIEESSIIETATYDIHNVSSGYHLILAENNILNNLPWVVWCRYVYSMKIKKETSNFWIFDFEISYIMGKKLNIENAKILNTMIYSMIKKKDLIFTFSILK